MDGGDPTLLTGIALFIILLMSYWALRGIGQLFERYNPILVMIFLSLVSSLCFTAFLLGMFAGLKTNVCKRQ